MKKILVLFLINVAWGCSSKHKNQVPAEIQKLENLTMFPASAKSMKIITFKKDVVYRDSEKILIGRIGNIDVDSLGRVFLADVQEKTIHVFEPDGKFTTQLGREGRGPGEFGYIKSLHIRNNRLYAFDSNQSKVNVFSLDTFEDIKTLSLARNRIQYPDLKIVYPQIDQLYVKNNDTYIVKFKTDSSIKNIAWRNFDIRGLFYPLDNTGKISSDKLFDFKMTTGTQVGTPHSNALIAFHLKDFFGSKMVVLSNDNSIYLVESDHFLIKVYSQNGVYSNAFYYPQKKIALSQESAVKAELSDLYLDNWESIDRPKNWPAVIEMKVDDQNRLWVATTVENINIYEWWVLEPSGEVIAKFDWLRTKPIQQILNGCIYTKESDETGVEYVVKYRFEFNEKQ